MLAKDTSRFFVLLPFVFFPSRTNFILVKDTSNFSSTKQKPLISQGFSHLLRITGLEPARRGHQNLNLARLPIPPHPHILNYCTSDIHFLIKTESPKSNVYYTYIHLICKENIQLNICVFYFCFSIDFSIFLYYNPFTFRKYSHKERKNSIIFRISQLYFYKEFFIFTFLHKINYI